MSEVHCSITPVSGETIDYSKIDSWQVISGETLSKIYPDSKVDYLIQLTIKTPGDQPNINLDDVNMLHKVYDHSGKLIKEAFGTQAKVLASIPSGEVGAVTYHSDKVSQTIKLKAPKQK